jgi:hypothetical protein
MKTTITIFCLLIAQLAQAQEYTPALLAAKMDLDSAWEQRTIPSADRICLPESSNLLRKKQLSDHDCLVVAIKTAKTQGAEAAVPWLVASQCYNQPGQDRVSKAGVDAVRYVMNKWGGGQGEIAGFNKPEVIAPKPVDLNMSFTNQTGDWLYIYSLDTDIADGKRACEDYVYVGKLAVNRSYNRSISKGKYVWIRFATKEAKNGCVDFIKEYKLGPKPGQTASVSEEVFIK